MSPDDREKDMEGEEARVYVLGAWSPRAPAARDFRDPFALLERIEPTEAASDVERCDLLLYGDLVQAGGSASEVFRAHEGGCIVSEYPAGRAHVVALHRGHLRLLRADDAATTAGALIRAGLLPASAPSVPGFAGMSRDEILSLACLGAYATDPKALVQWSDTLRKALTEGRARACDIAATTPAIAPEDPEERVADAVAFRRLYADSGRAADSARAIVAASALRRLSRRVDALQEGGGSPWLDITEDVGCESSHLILSMLEAAAWDPYDGCDVAAYAAYRLVEKEGGLDVRKGGRNAVLRATRPETRYGSVLLPYEWGGAEDPDAEACEDAVMGLYGGAETYTLEEVRERLGL